MEHVIAPATLRLLLEAVARGVRLPHLPNGAIVSCEGVVVARRAAAGAVALRCYRSAHGTAAAYADLQAALRALAGPPGPCATCGGAGWLAVGTAAAREAASAGLAFGAYRGVRFGAPADPGEADALLRATSLAALLAGTGGCRAG
jgi:hypothetical protein